MIVAIRFAVVLLAAVAFPALRGASAQAQAQAQAQRSPDAVARGLQTRYDGVQDFSADFVQSYRGGVLKTKTTERGTVTVKKPGKMRWLYTSPERKELVSDGSKIYWYLPEDKQVTVFDAGLENQATTSALFLSGKGNITRDFTPSLTSATAAGTIALKLVPRRTEPEYEYLVVALDPTSLQMRGLTTKDRQGGESTWVFTNMKENRRPSDKDFVFRIPRGVTVVNDGTR
jgi:outer membrane lipoprotein carrier protein